MRRFTGALVTTPKMLWLPQRRRHFHIRLSKNRIGPYRAAPSGASGMPRVVMLERLEELPHSESRTESFALKMNEICRWSQHDPIPDSPSCAEPKARVEGYGHRSVRSLLIPAGASAL